MPKNQKRGIGYQLGAYYDMRYMQYFTRFRFILGLLKYNEDDTAPEREEEMKVIVEDLYKLLYIRSRTSKDQN